jgi:biopolymer transport protein ExbD
VKFTLPEEAELELSMDMTPMIDVVFLLIIFFLASAALSVGAGEEEIQLPEASEARPSERLNPETITIEVKPVADGAAYSVSGKGYGYAELLRRLRVQVETAGLLRRAAPPVILRADFRVPYRYIQQLMFDCAAMGIEQFDFQAETGAEMLR